MLQYNFLEEILGKFWGIGERILSRKKKQNLFMPMHERESLF